MSTSYEPSCPACRSNHPTEFHRSCEGCRVRQARATAQQRVDLVSDEQVKATDSTMEPLKESEESQVVSADPELDLAGEATEMEAYRRRLRADISPEEAAEECADIDARAAWMEGADLDDGSDLLGDPDEHDEEDFTCERCRDDGRDPYNDYLLPCPECQGEQTP